MLKVLPAALLLSLAATSAWAQGPEPSPPPALGSWAFAFGAASDNRSKDVSKSDGNPYVFAEAEWTSADGLFYAAPSIETIKAGGSEAEVELAAGFRPEVAGFDLDLKAAYKSRLGADAGYDHDTVEFTGHASRSIGPANARLQVQYSPDATGSTKAFTWIEARLGWAFTDQLEGTAAVGRREQENSIDYTGWNAGVTYAVRENLEFDLRWYDTDADVPGEQYEGELVAGVSVYF